MKPRFVFSLWLSIIAVVLLGTSAASAVEGYALDWWAIDGGGGVATGGRYTVSSSIAQPDAGEMSGGTYSLTGGIVPPEAGAGAPAPFGKIGPMDVALVTAFAVTLSWDAAPGSMFYEYCYYDSAAPPCEDTAWLSTTDTSAPVSNLTAHTTYNWQVRAVNDAGKSQADTDAWWSFRTPSAAGSVTRYSSKAQDGWVLESAEASNFGGSLNATDTLLYIGDSAARSQYRGILSFKGGLPPGTVITSAVLKFCKAGVAGRSPFGTLGNLVADIRTGAFANNSALQLADFRARVGTAGRMAAMSFTNTPVGGCYSKPLRPEYLKHVDPVGITQLRLRFVRDDNNNAVADYLKIYSGNCATAICPATKRPVLVITYYLP